MDHVCATNVETILLEYNNGVKTLIICNEWSASYICNEIDRIIRENKTDIEREVSEKEEDEYICGYVWLIDSFLNYNTGSSQWMIDQNDVINNVTIRKKIDVPFDLGESDDLTKVKGKYPKYKYPYS